MNDRFHLFQDENAQYATFGSTVQPNPQQDGFVDPKGAVSARKALGNITNNNNGGFISNRHHKSVDSILGGEHVNGRTDVGFSASQKERVSLKETSIGKSRTVQERRIDNLVSGGIESSAGPTWEQQEGLKQLDMESSMPAFDVRGHHMMVEKQIAEFCNESIVLDDVETKVRFFQCTSKWKKYNTIEFCRYGVHSFMQEMNVIRDIMMGHDDTCSDNVFSRDILSPTRKQRKDSSPSLSELSIYSDDLANELP